jgi:hypothetical protein
LLTIEGTGAIGIGIGIGAILPMRTAGEIVVAVALKMDAEGNIGMGAILASVVFAFNMVVVNFVVAIVVVLLNVGLVEKIVLTTGFVDVVGTVVIAAIEYCVAAARTGLTPFAPDLLHESGIWNGASVVVVFFFFFLHLT